MVAVDAILNGADDGHGPDAHRQGCRHEAVDELVVAVTASLVFEPLAKAFKLCIQINKFTQQRTQRQR